MTIESKEHLCYNIERNRTAGNQKEGHTSMITIKPDRSAFIPQGEELIGYENDHGAMTRVFVIKETLPEDCAFRIDVENTSDIIIPEKTSLPDGRTVLTWTITSAVTQTAGVITVQLRAFDTDGTLIWHSAPIDFRCERSVHAVNEASTDPIITEFEQIEQRVEEAAEHCEDCADEAAATLQELIDEVGDVSDTIRELGEHLLDTDNPHEVTAAEVGAYTKSETDTLLNGKLPVSDGTALGSLTAAGPLYVLDVQHEKNITIDPYASEMSFDKPGTISGLSAPTDNADAATKGYVDGITDGKLDTAGGTMTGPLNVNDADLEQTSTLDGASLTFDSPGHVYNLALPNLDDEAASKRYTDAIAEQTMQTLDPALYDGVDLTVKFAAEIARAPYSGNAWAWIKARITAGNFAGIRICDYIPFVADGKTFNAQVAGINTYKSYGDQQVGNHIDFICKELWHVNKPINPVNYNNGLIPVEEVTSDGTSTVYMLTKEMNGIASIVIGDVTLEGYTYDADTYTITFESAPAAGTMVVTGTGTEYPWLACDLYHWLNSLSGQIPNSTTLNPDVKHVDYTSSGVYDKLPSALRAVIRSKRMYLNKRYSKTGLLTNCNSAGWVDLGNLWLPTESEVYGQGVWNNVNWAMAGTALQYPLFAGSMRRVKNRAGGGRHYWWLLVPYSGLASHWCFVNNLGNADNATTLNASIAAPVCFRIAA